MLKRVAACLLICASIATWMSCSTTTSSKYLYAAIPASNEIVAYREDPNAGVLTQLVGSPITAGQAVESLALHPSKKFLYAANSGTNPFGTVSLFTIASGGGLTEVTPRVNAGTSPTILAMDSAGSFLYVGNSGSEDISVFSIDASTGVLTPIPQQSGATQGLGLAPLNMQLSPSGNMLYVTGEAGAQGYIEAFSVTAGALTPLTPVNIYLTGNNPYGLAIDAGGTFLYTANTQDSSISEFTINADGSLSPLPGSPNIQTANSPSALLIDKSGKYMYVANTTSPGTLFAYSIGTDGSLSLITNSQFSTAANPNFIASDPAGKYLFVGNQSSPVIQSLSLNASSGILTSVATYSVPSTPTSIVITP